MFNGSIQALRRAAAVLLLLSGGCSQGDDSESALAGYRAAGFRLIQDQEPARALEMFAKFPEDTNDAQVHLGRGLAREAQGEWKHASSEFRAAAELDPANPAIRTTYARLLVAMKDWDGAREQARKALEAQDKRFTAAGLLAVVAQTPDQHAEALAALEKVLTYTHGRLPAEYLWLATDAALAAGKPDAAQRFAVAAREAEPLEVGNAFLFAATAYELEKRQLTIALLKTLTKFRDTEIDRLLPAIEMAFELGDVATARTLAKQLPEAPPHPGVLLARGRLHLLDHEPVAAAAAFREGLDLHALRAVKRQLTIGLAQALVAGKKSDEALAVVTAWVEEAPDDVEAAVSAAQLLGNHGRHEDAVALLERTRKQQPTFRDALTLQLGVTLLTGKQPQKAEVELASLMEAGHLDAALPLASALYAQGKRERGDEVLDSAMGKATADSPLMRKLAHFRLASSKDDHAIDAVRARLQDASDPVRAGLLLAQVHAELGDTEAEARQLEQLIKSYPDQAAAWSSMAEFRYRQGNLTGAMEAERTALEHSKDQRHSLQALATWTSEAGLVKDSLSALQRLIEVDPLNVVALNNAASVLTDEMNQPERAVPLAAKAYELSDAAAACDTYGWALLQRGKPADEEKAYKLLERASMELNAAEADYHFAVALSRRGLDQAADQILQTILQRDEDFPGKDDAAELLAKHVEAAKAAAKAVPKYVPPAEEAEPMAIPVLKEEPLKPIPTRKAESPKDD